MMRELLLLRHGKAGWGEGIVDFHRPLKDRGKRDAQRVGVWLAQQSLLPDLVLSSPAERAVVTAQKCCKAMGIYAKHIQTDERIYLAKLDDLLAVLADIRVDARRVLLVGHNPGLEYTVNHLAQEPIECPKDGNLMPTATLARFELSSNWNELKKRYAKLLQLIRATDLPDKFPYPMPDSTEQRDRPAYYYTQSSVIPYRINNEKLEIMIIRSSQNKHWVIPKGIADPGRTLQESAAKEAWEEAGVEGDVQQQAVGTYNYKKWGATCTVTVFPMKVTHQFDENEWQERHRGRQWVTPQDAVKLLKQVELGPMIVEFEKQLRLCLD